MAVIVAILAAVAIPTYSNYVRGQRQETVKNLAQTVAISANSFWRRNNEIPAPDGINLEIFLPDPSKYSIVVSATHVIVSESADHTIRDSARYIPE